MRQTLAIVTDVRSVCLPVSLSVMRLKSAAARAVYAAFRMHRVIWCSLCQMPLGSCLLHGFTVEFPV